MQSSACHRRSVGLLILVTPFLTASLTGCGAVDSELGFTLGVCDILNCDTLFFLGLDDDHDDMADDHDDMAMEEDHDAMDDGMEDDQAPMDMAEDADQDEGEHADDVGEGATAERS